MKEAGIERFTVKENVDGVKTREREKTNGENMKFFNGVTLLPARM